MSAAALKNKLDSAWKEIKKLKKENEKLTIENYQLPEKNELFCKQNRKLLEEVNPLQEKWS